MRLFSEETIQQVIDQNDIVDIISGYVTLKRSGTNYKANCPFHNEKTPSFMVSTDKQLYHCFGCGAGGNVISFIMAIENLSFVDAVKFLAERSGIILPDTEKSFDNITYKKKERQFQIHKDAAKFFHQQLISNIVAQKYLFKRGINKLIIKKFGLGYAPNSRDTLFKHLMSEKYSIEEILSSGLVLKSNKYENQFYDRFRNRIMFPIVTVTNNVIAFGGRVLDNNVPKYLNSPETLIFSKGKQLYGLNKARKSMDKGRLVIVEGYMDVISLYQNGIENVIASLGTALTVDQGRLLKRYANEVVIAYDGDEAGQKATIRGLDILNKTGLRIKVLVLPDEMDPDDCIKQLGQDEFIKMINNSLSLVEYKVHLLKKKYPLDTTEGKIDFTKKVAKILKDINSEIEIDAYIKKIAEDTNIDQSAIKLEVYKYKKYKNGKNSNINNRNNIGKSINYNVQVNAYIKVQEIILNFISQDKELFNRVAIDLGWEDFSEGTLKNLAKMIYKKMEQNEDVIPSKLLVAFNDVTEAKYVASIFALNNDYIKDIDIENYLNRFKYYKIKSKIANLEDQLKKSISNNNSDQLNNIYCKIVSLKRELESFNNTGKEGY